MQLKGRHLVLLWLLLFLVVASFVVARQSAAFAQARELSRLRQARVTLEARQADLERRLREASSRRVLGERAARMGLRAPADSELTMLPRPNSSGRERP